MLPYRQTFWEHHVTKGAKYIVFFLLEILFLFPQILSGVVGNRTDKEQQRESATKQSHRPWQKACDVNAGKNAGQNQSPQNQPAVGLFKEVNWFVLEPRKNKWLVDGLLLRRGSSLLVGKPKAGKSTVARNFAVSVLKGHSILGRSVEVTGKKAARVAYFLLEGKDDERAFAEQMRAMGVTAEEVSRLRLYVRDGKGKLEERVAELVAILKSYPADFVVIDTLRLFTGKAVKDTNSYDDTVEAMDNIEPVLRKAGWHGHLNAVHHGRKDDEKKNQMLDSILGSTGLAASFNTVILISHPDDDEPLRLICSKQNETEKAFGDMPKTELLCNEDTFAVSLGRAFKEIEKQQKNQQREDLSVKIQRYLGEHPNCTMPDLQESVSARKQSIVVELVLLTKLNIVTRNGQGTKKSPFTYSMTASTEGVAA